MELGLSRKPASPAAGRAILRCATVTRRLLALARALRGGENIHVCFAVAEGDPARAHQAGFEAHRIAAEAEFTVFAASRAADLLLFDGGCSRAGAEALRGPLMAAIEDSGDLRLACDFAYYPPLPQFMSLGWTGARTVPRIGWGYALLGTDPHGTPVRAVQSRPTLLVTGSDVLVEKAARMLAPLDASFRIRFVIAGAGNEARKLAAAIVAMKANYETVEGADDLATEYAAAELALCAFGDAAFELAAFGVPAVYVGESGDDVTAADAFAAAGMGISLGELETVTDAQMLGAVRKLMGDAVRRREMRATALGTMDGFGAVRIAAELAQAIREERMPLKAAQ